MSERAQLLLEIADDELILGWRNSEWTGIAPFLEEDVAFSSIAQNEIGHARALYQLVADELGTTADELAFDRSPQEYRCSPLRPAPARPRLGADDCPPRLVRGGGRAANRGAQGVGRRRGRRPGGQDRPRGGLPPASRPDVARAAGRGAALRSRRSRSCARSSTIRGEHTADFEQLWEEMTMVRRSVPGATW